jgi:hypothetical protein
MKEFRLVIPERQNTPRSYFTPLISPKKDNPDITILTAQNKHAWRLEHKPLDDTTRGKDRNQQCYLTQIQLEGKTGTNSILSHN